MTWEQLVEKIKERGLYRCLRVNDAGDVIFVHAKLNKIHLAFFKNGLVEAGVDLSYLPQFSRDGMIRFDTLLENATFDKMYAIITALTETKE